MTKVEMLEKLLNKDYVCIMNCSACEYNYVNEKGNKRCNLFEKYTRLPHEDYFEYIAKVASHELQILKLELITGVK